MGERNWKHRFLMGSRPTHLKFSASNSSTNFWGKDLRAVVHPGVGHSHSHPVDFAEVLAFRVRLVAALVQQEPVLGFSFGVWLQCRVSLIEVDSSGSSSGSDEEMSLVEEEIEESTSLCNQLLPSDRRFRH